MSPRLRLHHQRGVASLVVVALLFFVLSLVAAYTNRNLIFEQRTSGNQYRSTQAFEAAEAGVEWALSLLNAGRIDANCTPSTDPTDTTFRQRYLTIDAASGVVGPAGPLTGAFESTVWPSCVFDGADWACSCPSAGAPAVAAPTGDGVFPAFRVRFSRASATQPGVVRLEVNGCTRLDDACLDFPAQGLAGEGRATVSTLIALRSGLPAPPAAAMTVRGDASATALRAANTDPTTGIALLIGGTADPSIDLTGPAGSPPATSLRQDAALAAMPADRLFVNTFAIWPDEYREQPGAVVLDCAGLCNAQDVRDAAQAHPGRVIWADGNVSLDTGGDVGSPAAPVLLVATGNVDVGVTLHGLLVSRAASWDTGTGSGRVHGAVIAEGDVTGSGAFTAIHDPAILTRLRWTTGSFVRVPGAWRDF